MTYDFLLTVDGTLTSLSEAAKAEGLVMILLENEGDSPTAAQVSAIESLTASNPGCKSTFFLKTGTRH